MDTPRPWETLSKYQLRDLLNAHTTTLAPGPWAAPRPSHMRSNRAPAVEDAFNPDAAYPLAPREPHRG